MEYRLTKRRQIIAAIFDDLDLSHPGKSTEWLIALTCDVFAVEVGHPINNSDVCEALIAQGQARERAEQAAPKFLNPSYVESFQ